MDPNLVKFAQSHIDTVRVGNTRLCYNQARDYLCYVLKFNTEQIEIELKQFSRYMKSLKERS